MVKNSYDENEPKFRHIIVSAGNYEKLKKIGSMADSFNDVVTILLTKNDDATSPQNAASSTD